MQQVCTLRENDFLLHGGLQLDLALEARHLARFNRNFRSWRNLSFPLPIFPLVAPDVLVETFEQVGPPSASHPCLFSGQTVDEDLDTRH